MECPETQPILQITHDLITTVSPEQLLRKIVRTAVTLLQTESAGLLLCEGMEYSPPDTAPHCDELRFRVVSHYEEHLLDVPVPIAGSIAGQVFTTNAPLIVSDVPAHPVYYPAVEKLTEQVIVSLLAVPLCFKGRRIGVLEVVNKCDGTPFDAADVRCLTTLAAQAALALENARLVAALEHRVIEREAALQTALRQQQMLEVLQQVNAVLTSTLHYEEVLDRILAHIGALVAYDAVNVMLVEGDVARICRGRGYEHYGTADILQQIALKIPEVSGLATMRQTLQPIIIPDVTQDDAWVYSHPEHQWIQSYIGVPIHRQNRLFGYMNLLSATPGFYTEQDAEQLESLAQQAAIAIHNAYLYQQAQREIDERERAELALQRHQEHLEDLVAERTSDLQRAVAQTHELNTQLAQEIVEREQLIGDLQAFSGTVAHDLKNPLSLVIGYSGLLVDVLPPASQERESAEVILKTGNKMGRIITELLQFANVRQANVELVPVQMPCVIVEVEERLASVITQYQAEIIQPAQWPNVMGHAAWVEEVWANYISNALKYGGRPEEHILPRVELGYTRLDNETASAAAEIPGLWAKLQHPENHIAFWVRDNGPGLTPQAQQRLFAPFTRLDKTRAEGHGLGLSIVKRMVEKLGGEVGVTSVMGQGTVFFFTLPVKLSPRSLDMPAESGPALTDFAAPLADLCTDAELQAMEMASAIGHWEKLHTWSARIQQRSPAIGNALLDTLNDFNYADINALVQAARAAQAACKC